MQIYEPSITGSLNVSGSTIIVGNLTVSGTLSSTDILSGTASFAQTASYINTLNQSVEITGLLTVTGSQVELFTDLFRVNTPDGSVNVLVVDSNGVQLSDPSGNQGVAVTLSNRKLYDSASFDSVNWTTRQLIKSNGSTVAFDWENSDIPNSLTQGSANTAIGTNSHAEGQATQAIGEYSHAEGSGTQAIGNYSHAEGNGTQAIGNLSHAEGESTLAIGYNSHTEGASTKTGTQNAYYAESVSSGVITLSGSYGDISNQFNINDRLYLYDTPFDQIYFKAIFLISQSYYSSPNTIVELYDTSVTTTTAYVGSINYGIYNWTGDQTIPGDYSHTEGNGTQAIGNYSHAEGGGTIALGDHSHVEGDGTQAIGEYSHAEGSGTQAIGNYSHAEGYKSLAIGSYSHAEGGGDDIAGTATRAYGQLSHAEGYNTTTVGYASHAEGNSTIASGSYQHVSGRYNTHGDNTSLFIIGNGVDDNNRSDVFRVTGSQVQITGSLRVTQGITGSLFGTSSWASTAQTASYATSAELLDGKDSSVFATTGSNTFTATQIISGALQLNSTTDPDLSNSNPNSSYFFVSSSGDNTEFNLHYRNNGALWETHWLEERADTGLVWGGVLTFTGTTMSITPGAGLIVNHNTSTSSHGDTVPTYVQFGPITASAQFITSSQVTYLLIDSNGSLVQQTSIFTPQQYNEAFPLGYIFCLTTSSISSYADARVTTYGQDEQQSQFIRAFGPLKVSGYDITPQSGSLKISIASGRAYRVGGFYSSSPDNPSLHDSTNVATGSLVRVYRDPAAVGGFKATLNGLVPFTDVDPTMWDDGTGTLAAVGASEWTIQRLFQGVVNNITYIYYGQNKYDSLAAAIQSITTEAFEESQTSILALPFIGYIICRGNTTNLADTTNNKLINSGLFRNTAGSSGGGGVATTNLNDLADVNITSPANGQALVYNLGNWINSNPDTASFALNSGTASFVNTAQTASYVLNAVSSSYGATSSYSTTLAASIGQNAAGTIQLKNSANSVISSINVNTITSSLAYTASFVNPLFQNVSIGTTQTISPLTIISSASPLITVQSTTANSYSNIRFSGSGNSYTIGVGNASETTFGVPNEFFIYDDTAGAMRMTVSTAGNVGIGTTNPGALLHVAGAVSASNFTGSLQGTASFATSASYAVTASFSPENAATSGVGSNPTTTSTQTITHGLGRTPIKIRIYGASQFTSNASATATPFSMGTWTSSGNRCVYQPYNTAAITTTQNSATSTTFAIRIDTAANVFTQGVIQNVGATTFDIAWTATGTPGARSYLWEAE